MCGIAGFELRHGNERTAAVLLDRLARRGPDGGWYTPVQPYGLVQTRLSVIDLSDRVRYPLRNESGDLHLLFNGEIYEHARHRAELERRGHRFTTDCDAEVVLHGYEEWGMEMFRRLDGMFAIALLHEPSGELLLVRDTLGIKPLVYTAGNRFSFSSDALSLVAAGCSAGETDASALSEYVALHYLVPPSTGLTDVVQLEPGEALRRQVDGSCRTDRWRARPFTIGSKLAAVEVEEAAGALDQAVRHQLVADVPVGVLLSSGVDSSLVLDCAVRSGASPTAFTMSFRGHGDYDEAPTAARFTAELGVPHVVGELSGGFADTIGLVSEAFDQPLADASAIATVHLARLARDRVTVALSGTGGDDLFAGYYRHRLHVFGSVLSRLPRVSPRLLTALQPERGSERQSALALARSYAARLAALDGADPFSQYLQLVGSNTSARGLDVLRGAVAPLTDLQPVADRLLAPRSSQTTTLQHIQAFELATYLPGDLLPKEDRATMAVGLEARVPLLANGVIELAERVPDRQKISAFGGKRLLREVARRRLPGYITHARKRGFAVPLADLFAGPWRTEAADWFGDSGSSLVDGPAVHSGIGDGTLPATDVWALASLIAWENHVRRARREGQAASPGASVP